MGYGKQLHIFPRDLLARIAYYVVVDEDGGAGHPACLVPFYLSCRTIYQAISFANNPQLYKELYLATFDFKAMLRRFSWMALHLTKKKSKVFHLFDDPRTWAADYRGRWETSRRLRHVARYGRINVEGVCDKTTFVEDLWNVWFLITENDGKNMPFLFKHCKFRQAFTIYYREILLQESLLPGYPTDSGEKALAAWCSLYAGIDMIGEDTPEEVDEKIFLFRPYVFACAKYDVTYASWRISRLPLCDPDCNDHSVDPTIRSKAMVYRRFGYLWRRVPPHFILAVYILFLRLLERQPDRVGLRTGGTTFSRTPFEANMPGIFSSYKIIHSYQHDQEWQRNTACQDPHTGQGLPVTVYRGSIQGFWRGKFLFYDFTLYRQILGGNMRGVYTGMFAEQEVEMELKETLVKVKKDQVGGDGQLLHAGFEDMEDMDEAVKFTAQGYGHRLAQDNEEDEEGWTKEILITGTGRTCWGRARIRGRVRTWDGLINMALAYDSDPSARWLWRGYLHTGGFLIGRWRDCFTPDHMRGYEGAFGMIRAGEAFYPDHFPKHMEDTLGVDHASLQVAQPIPSDISSYPSQPTNGSDNVTQSQQ
nr:hypothetical protein L204_06431 [Cryptococcus depauperatus CBS 7855]